jgi:hypothetical protein
VAVPAHRPYARAAMARLRQADGSGSWLLPARCLLGRSRACALRLSEPEVSGEHALVRWNGGTWELQDLHSRNGSFIDGRRVDAGQRVKLSRGCALGFGRPDGYVLSDDGAPQPFAVHLGVGRVVEAQGGFLALPEPARPELTIYRAESGWVTEQGLEVHPVEDGETVETRVGRWLLHLPELLPRTCEHEPTAPTIGTLTLRFCVSRDEEYIELQALHGARVFDLKARVHHYPLLLLARVRLADEDASPEWQGWIHQDELLRQLRSDANRLHIDIYRCRRQFAEIGIADAAQIVERRAGTRQLRIGVRRLEITSLARGQSPPVSAL